MTSHAAAHPSTTTRVLERDTACVPTARLLAAAAVSAVIAAAASRPWGLGLLALVAFVPAFDAIARAPTVLIGAALAAAASLGVASVAYEATVAIGVHFYALALLLAPLPYAATGAVAVRFGRAVGRGGAGPLRGAAPRFPTARGAARGAARAGAGGAAHTAAGAAVLAALPVLWCAAEWLPAQPRLWGVYALPLGAIGYSQAELPTLHLASLSSVTAVSAAVLAVNALLVAIWRTRLPVLRLGALTAVAGLALVVALVSQNGSGGRSSGTALLRLIQPNLPDSAYLAANHLPSARRALIESLLALSAPPAGDRDTPALTILPEAVWPGPPAASSSPPGQVDPLFRDARLQGPVLFGAPSRGRTSVGHVGTAPTTTRGATWFANSAFLLADGVLTRVQDKLHLVPIAEAGLRAGSGPAVFAVGAMQLAVLICYDVVFPATSRAAAAAGASLLAVLTDDSFAARGDVPKLHARLAVFRAVETGLPVALASNTGPSVLVDSSGQTVARSPALVATSLTAALPLGRRATAYSAYGDWLGVLAVLGALAIGAVAALRGGGAGSFSSRPA